jgi:hypothetical protein
MPVDLDENAFGPWAAVPEVASPCARNRLFTIKEDTPSTHTDISNGVQREITQGLRGFEDWVGAGPPCYPFEPLSSSEGQPAAG